MVILRHFYHRSVVLLVVGKINVASSFLQLEDHEICLEHVRTELEMESLAFAMARECVRAGDL